MHIVILPRRAAIQAQSTAFPGIKKAPAAASSPGPEAVFIERNTDKSGARTSGGRCAQIGHGSALLNNHQQHINAIHLLDGDACALDALQDCFQVIVIALSTLKFALLNEILRQQTLQALLCNVLCLNLLQVGVGISLIPRSY